MADLTATEAFHGVGLGALICLMADLVALEAEFGVAVEGVVGVFAAQNAVGPTPIIWALFRHVAELPAVPTLDCGVEFNVVPRHLVFHL